MNLIDIAKKFSQCPDLCTNEEIAALAENFNLANPEVEQLIQIANQHVSKWSGMVQEIKRAHFERQHFDALSKNPFASQSELEAMPQPGGMDTLSQDALAALVFKA